MNKIFLGIMLLALFPCCAKDNNGNNFVPDQSVVRPETPTSPTTPTTQEGFVHPGVLNTSASLDLIAAQVNSSDPTRTAAYKKVTDFINSHTYPTSFYPTVYVGSNGHTSPSKSQIRSDAELAYAYALRFARTADIADANKTIGILNGWASNFLVYNIIDNTDNPNQPALEASWTTPSFVAAAEIIRHYKPKGVSANWKDKDIRKFNTYLKNVHNNYIKKVPNYTNNWNVSAGYATIAIGVFLDSESIYEEGKDILNTILPLVIKSDGTMPELCDRSDCVHYQYSLTGLTYGAEIAAIQGDNSLYSALSNRIFKGYDFMRNAYDKKTGCNFCSASSPVFPGVEVALKHYGANSSMQSLRDLQAPLGVPNDNTFLGFTSYTHYKLK